MVKEDYKEGVTKFNPIGEINLRELGLNFLHIKEIEKNCII
jgi:hypothetical protein